MFNAVLVGGGVLSLMVKGLEAKKDKARASQSQFVSKPSYL